MSDSLPIEVKQSPIVYFSGHKSIFTQSGVFTRIHEGSYAINIKSNTTPQCIPAEDAEEAFNVCKSTFFMMVENITKLYGYCGFSVEGRSGGWLKPLVEVGSYSFAKAIAADPGDYISFNEYLIQKKFESYAEEIIKVKETIETALRYSRSLEQLEKLLSEIFERLL